MSLAWENWIYDNYHWWIGFLLTAIPILIYIKRGRCPSCEKYFTYKRTGNRNDHVYEYKCDDCDNVGWIDCTPSRETQ